MGVDSLFRELWSGISNASPPRLPAVPPVTSASGSKAPSTVSTTSDSDTDAEIDTKGSTNPSMAMPDTSQHSEPSVNTDPLSDDHPIHLLEEARKFYRNRQPPFVLSKRSQVSKTCVVPTKDGLRPKYPSMIQITARPWDDKSIFWTVDVNHKRYIVKAFSGGKGQSGAKYLHWAGPGNDFQEPPLALSEFSSVNLPPRAPVVYTSSADEDEVISDPLEKRRRRAATVDTSSDDENPENEPISARTKRLRIGGSPVLTASTATLQPIDNDANPGRASQQTTNKNALKKGRKPTRHSELPPRTSHHLSQSHEGRRKRRKTDIYTREVSRLYSVTPPALRQSGNRLNGSAAPASQTQLTSRPAQQSTSSSTGLFANSFTAQPAPQPAGSPTILDQSKQNRTTLFVRVAPSAEYQPLKLSECTDLSTFFTKVLGAWALAEAKIGKVTVAFNWMDVDDKMRVMFMNPNQEACFTHLIEEVEDAPCWNEERGKCMLDVEIVLRE
ncbi:hypothetical protein OEA41_001488 [Lepraria neglecta]|uniref:Uncharacterized protein n=1 Tax=Lepraria neglecta TaxID=209136 RepID=A0AAD9Z9P9_9LECA|nr:hypothetical protein OEA41_001488 [Lepraria neglecta]